MKKKSKMILVFILCFSAYALINNTLDANNAPARMHIFSWIPILIVVVYDFRIILKKMEK